jgi:phosphopantetheinyl transferase
VKVAIDGYATATVVFDSGYPPAPPRRTTELTNEVQAPVSAQDLYRLRWMFHGPAFQGITDLGPVADNGIRGTIVSQPTPGALLDNAGQLMGYWVMLHTDRDRLAFPVAIERIRFFGPQPAPGQSVECRVWVTKVDETLVSADLELCCGGVVWAQIEQWSDRRFETDEVIWPVLRYPEDHLLADPGDSPYVLVRERWKSSASRELIMRRYLTESERREYESKNPRAQRQWLLGRMAAKDAVRRWLRAHGGGPLFPAQIRVDNDERGRPLVSGPFQQDLRVSIAHKEGLAVAIVGEGTDAGIDLELIAPRPERFADMVLTESEQALQPDNGGRDEWLTRLWTGKEAAAKARGTGLSGRPRDFEVSRIDGGRMRVADSWIESRREGDFIVSWTEQP